MRKIVCITLLFVLSISMSVVSAQQCDPVVQEKSLENWTLKYRERENRCEGFYGSEVSSQLEIVGLTQGRFQYALDVNEIIEISSPIVLNQPVNVRAVGIPSKTYYRLDAVIQPEETLIWPVDEVLDVKKLPARDLGVFGWIGEGGIDSYVPLTATTIVDPVENDRQIRLTLRPAVDVKNVQWRSAEVVNDACADMGGWTTLKTASYRKGEPIKILLPAGEFAALCVEVAVQSQRTAKWEKNLSKVIVGGN